MYAARQRRTCNQRKQSGFTLLEMLLALGLLVVVVGLSWPMFQGPLSNARLRSAADDVRIAMSEARVKAMTVGVTYQLECQLESRSYKISPKDGQIDEVEGSGSAAANAVVEKELPEKIKFTKTDTVDTRAVNSLSTNEIADFTQTTTKIYFYPDGSTSSAEVQVTNENDTSLVVSLRGVTGVALVVDPALQNSSGLQTSPSSTGGL